ncbi:hypothetical protein L2U69_01000 [Zavarzinia compransoris]|uniref:hypothetical protein n=1 Tax=Zavarzinia marina TaxID=2911065 RepID=UPI001F31F553|nr:hypothetical protein [Zavarzinia marina]MCF4164220.1 hypothetical protein [Zavarzinia marina]
MKSDGFGERDFKNVVFVLWNDRVVSYNFTSDMEGASTRFDASRIGQLQRGVTTKAQVIELLGTPAGETIYPLVRDKGNRQINYSYIGIGRSAFYTGTRDIELSFLEILLGPDDKVIDFRSQSETKTITPERAPSAPIMPIFIPTN